MTHRWSQRLSLRYIDALKREISGISDASNRTAAVDSIYFGGGTPSMIPPDQLGAVFACIGRAFDITGECEVSIEANPETITPGRAESYIRMGINRISVGVQSFVDAELQAIGRRHSAGQALDGIEVLRRAGFVNISLDLILGLPGQTSTHWKRTLETAAKAAPSHVSVYMLDTDDAKARIHREVCTGRCALPDDDLVADLYAESVDYLCRSGLAQYEISNFAHPGRECRHNLKYWTCRPVLGFGVSSHSFDGSARYANVAKLRPYLNLVEAGRSPEESRTYNDARRHVEEALFLGLRLNRGVDLGEIAARYGSEPLTRFKAALDEMSQCGLVEDAGNTVRLTARGRLMSNEVFSALLP